MKRAVPILVVLAVVLCFFGCENKVNVVDTKPSIVCTVFPVYDWITEVLGESMSEFDVHILGKGNMDLHSYQPSARDIAIVSNSDLIVYIGGTSDAWIEDIVKNNVNKDMRSLKLFDVLDTDNRLIADEHTHEHINNNEYDEHIWLSLWNASKIVKAVADEISIVDISREAFYKNNAQKYINQLDLLDAEYKIAFSASKDNSIVVADRFPFLYLMEDYGIEYYAAFPGCSSDSDVSFDTVVSLAETADRLNKHTILVTENSADAIAESVISAMKNKNIETAVLNSCQTVSDIENSDYIDIMRKNLVSLKSALK